MQEKTPHETIAAALEALAAQQDATGERIAEMLGDIASAINNLADAVSARASDSTKATKD